MRAAIATKASGSSSLPCERPLSPPSSQTSPKSRIKPRKGSPSAWRFSSRIAAFARRPSGRFADFSEIGVHTCLCLKLVRRRGWGESEGTAQPSRTAPWGHPGQRVARPGRSCWSDRNYGFSDGALTQDDGYIAFDKLGRWRVTRVRWPYGIRRELCLHARGRIMRSKRKSATRPPVDVSDHRRALHSAFLQTVRASSSTAPRLPARLDFSQHIRSHRDLRPSHPGNPYASKSTGSARTPRPVKSFAASLVRELRKVGGH